MDRVAMITIDELRSLASDLCKEKQAAIRIFDTYQITVLKNKLTELEASIDTLLMRYHRQPNCPYCPGKLLTTPTVGILKCENVNCQATVLRGRR